MSTILDRVTEVVKNLDHAMVTTDETGVYVVLSRQEGEDTYRFQRRIMDIRSALSAEGIAVLSSGGSLTDVRDFALAVTSVD